MCILYRIGHLKTSKMLPIVLVLLVATTAFAAPSVSVNLVPINSVSVPYDNGYGINSGLAAKLFELRDQADTNIYCLALEQAIQDLANIRDSYSQALAVSQILAILGEIAFGVPGSSCAAANAINQECSNKGGRSFLSRILIYIDAIAALSSNPASIRYSQAPSGSCTGGGDYQFEAAWNLILGASNPYNAALLNEEYCSTKRLYSTYSVSSNNIAAAVTAASLPSVVTPLQPIIPVLLNFLRAAADGNGYGYAAAAKAAVQRAH